MKNFLLSPPIIFLLSIGFSLFLKANSDFLLEDVTGAVACLIFIAWLAFFLGYFLMRLLSPNIYFFKNFQYINKNKKFHSLVNKVFAISMLSSAIIFFLIFSNSGWDLAAFRDFYLGNQRAYFLFPYLLYFCATYYLLMYAVDKNKIYLVFFLVIAFSDSIFKLQKSSFLTFMWALIVVQVSISKFSIINFLKIMLTILLIVAFISYMFVFREGSGVELLLYSVTNYITVGFINFDLNIFEAGYLGCVNVFGAFGKYLLPSYYCDPASFETYGHYNVYSFLLEPYIFGGMTGLIFTCFLLGVVYFFIYRESFRSDFGLVMYAFLSFPLMLAFFAYAFNWNEWIYVYLFLLISYGKMAVKKK